MGRVPTRKEFETVAEELSGRLIYSKVSGAQAEQLLRRELKRFPLNKTHIRNGFSIRPPKADRYGFSVALSVEDEDGRTKVMQFDSPEKTWREL